MTPFTTIIGAAVLAVVVATLFWGGAGLVLALPLVFVVGAIAFALHIKKQRDSAASLHAHRERARTDKVEFTERDQQTLVSE
jgi:fatty acid desaturase